MSEKLLITLQDDQLLVKFSQELTLTTITSAQTKIEKYKTKIFDKVVLDGTNISYLDSAGALFLYDLQQYFKSHNISVSLLLQESKQKQTFALVEENCRNAKIPSLEKKSSFLEEIGKLFYSNYRGFLSFLYFFGQLIVTHLEAFISPRHLRFKEIAFEINESALKALGIIALTSFLIGVVVAYQSAYQLKMYGANIYIVDMLGLSILRELSPLITAIIIAGRSGSAYAAQIGAMKITQEIDAMETMGFDPFAFLVLPRIIALIVMMPILIFVSDIMAMLGGMIIAHTDLNISMQLFLDRFNEVIAAKHFFVGIVKGPFFAFLIASIGIYRGLMVKDDTQSIGFNTTKSVVESIFAVIICDAVFSIAFTNLGI